ncbi:MAG TPA: flavin reductase family protein [Gemmataceae bacterium]|jgi:flavin reductase (DIM6/NTAB) family NADH-FMN oxidoreductase RutF
MTHDQALTAALGRVPSGLFILTVARDGQETGMLASWVQQCSFDPPQVSLAVKPGRLAADLLADGAAFALNVLAAGQTDLLKHFGKGFGPGEPAFAGLDVYRTDEGVPVLRAALAHLDCRVAGRFGAGDHDLVIGRVVAGRLHTEGQPAVHVRKSGAHY